MESNLPATRAEPDDRPPLEPRQNVAVALLPLALIAFLVLTFIAAAWTFLAAA